MKPETQLLHKKYSYFLHLVEDERELFYDKYKNIIFEPFFDARMYILCAYSQIKVPYRNFINTRASIIKKFEYERYIIYIKYFKLCHDISDYILSFLFNNVI